MNTRTCVVAILALTAAVAVAENEPERVRRFRGAPVVQGSSPVVLAKGDSSLFVMESQSTELIRPEALWRVSGTDPVPVLVADQNPAVTWLTDPRRAMGTVGDSLFVGTSSALLRIDADESPRVLREIDPATYTRVAPLGVLRGAAMVSACLGSGTAELWKSDGTPEGTVVLRRFETDDPSAAPLYGVTVGSVFFFNALTRTQGRELWMTDGSEEGTVLAADLLPGSGSSWARPIGKVGGALMVTGRDSTGADVLWRTDGTPAGTAVLHRSETGEPPTGIALGDAFLFRTTDAVRGTELWRTDGTPAGTELVLQADVAEFFDTADGLAYFRVLNQARANELWLSDGTAGGTRRVVDAGASGPAGVTRGVALGDELVFRAHTEAEGSSLWRTDGSAAGTQPIFTEDDGAAVYVPDFAPNFYYRGVFEATDDAVWFSARGDEGLELWVSDGTRDGTRVVNLAEDRSDALHDIELHDGTLFLAATDDGTGRELWSSDGTEEGTEVRTALAPQDDASWVGELTDAGSSLLFVGGAGDAGRTQVRTATATGSALVASIEDDGSAGNAQGLRRAGDLVYFQAVFGSDVTGWRTDGTADGTISLDAPRAGAFVDVDGTTLFFASDNSNYEDLWASDGTLLGTQRIRALRAQTGQTRASSPVVFDGQLFFGANADTGGMELWRSDGTTDGTVRDADIVTGSGESRPFGFVVAGERLYFTGKDGDGASVLYARNTDGDVDRVWVAGNSVNTYPIAQVALGDDLLFVAGDPETGRELWLTDGRSEGTRMVRDIAVGAASSGPDGFLDVGGGQVVFRAADAARGAELWVTDGTRDGTLPVADLVPGPGSAAPSLLHVLGDDLFFAARSRRRTSDFWRIPLDRLANLEALSEPVALDPLPVRGPDGPEPAPLPDPPPVDPPVDPPVPEPGPLSLNALKIRLDSKRDARDSLKLKFRLPVACADDGAGVRLRLDVGGAELDVILDGRGRWRSIDRNRSVRVRTVKPRRRKDTPTEVNVVVKIRRAELATSLADENLVLPALESRVDRQVGVSVEWCDATYAADATVRYRERRGVGTAKLIDSE